MFYVSESNTNNSQKLLNACCMPGLKRSTLSTLEQWMLTLWVIIPTPQKWKLEMREAKWLAQVLTRLVRECTDLEPSSLSFSRVSMASMKCFTPMATSPAPISSQFTEGAPGRDHQLSSPWGSPGPTDIFRTYRTIVIRFLIWIFKINFNNFKEEKR